MSVSPLLIMRDMYKFLLVLVVIFSQSATPYLQSTVNHLDCNQKVQLLQNWYEEGAYLLVQQWTENHTPSTLSCPESVEVQIELFRVLSHCYLALLGDADLNLSNHAIMHPHTKEGTISSEHLAIEKFKIKDWLSALDWFERPQYLYSETIGQDEWNLAHGYVLFQLGRYESAISKWTDVKNKFPRYYYPAQYYSAIAYANLEDLDEAVARFESVKAYPPYANQVPYYIAQIYFELESYNEVVEITTPLLATRGVDPDVFRLAGLSAYQLGQSQKAITFLEEYLAKGATVSEEIYYILGLSYYTQKNPSKAKSAFESIAHQDSQYGQLANYYLADIALSNGDKTYARHAFSTAYSKSYNSQIVEQSKFYFGKLSAELRYDRDAIVHLREIDEDSPYFMEAQSIMTDLLLNTNDYSSALQTLKTIPNKGSSLLNAEHQLLLSLALEKYDQEDFKQCQELLQVVINRKEHLPAHYEAHFWMGELQYRENQHKEATKHYEKYLSDLNQSHVSFKGKAAYSQAYIQLKSNDYDGALEKFLLSNALETPSDIDADITLRLGDLYLKSNDYEAALKQYEKYMAINPDKSHDYALYQKAIILGLQQFPVKKIVTLETIIENYTSSKYLDDALFETGVTLHEMDKTKDALATFRFLVDDFENESPLVVPALLRMALISYNQGDLKQAADYYKEVFEFAPSVKEQHEALNGLQEIYVNDLTRPDVYLTLEKELGMGDSDNQRRDSLTFAAAQRQFDLGNHERSLEAFANYLEKYEDGQYEMLARYNQGRSALILENYDIALEAFANLCDLNSARFPDACAKGAQIAYHYAQDFELAQNLFLKSEKVSQSQEEQEAAIIGILQSAFRTLNDSLIYTYSQKVLSIEKLSDADRVFAHYCLGLARYKNGESALSVNNFNYVAKNNTGEMAAESRFKIAQVYYENNELSLAEKLCDQANKQNVNHPYWVAKGLILYSDILDDLGERFNARAALEAVINNATDFPELVQVATEKLQAMIAELNKENKLD